MQDAFLAEVTGSEQRGNIAETGRAFGAGFNLARPGHLAGDDWASARSALAGGAVNGLRV